MNNVVAQAELDVVWPNGRRVPVVVAIGQPYRDEGLLAWRCPVSLEGLSSKLPDVTGEDALQALLLALQLAHNELAGAEAGGAGSLNHGRPDDRSEVFELSHYFRNWPVSPD